MHWFFVQAIDAWEHDLYIPACSRLMLVLMGYPQSEFYACLW